MCLSVTSASTTIRPSTEATKVVKCRRSLKQVCRYFFLFSHPAVSRHFLGVFDFQDKASVFTTRMSWILSIPWSHRYCISRSPLYSPSYRSSAPLPLLLALAFPPRTKWPLLVIICQHSSENYWKHYLMYWEEFQYLMCRYLIIYLEVPFYLQRMFVSIINTINKTIPWPGAFIAQYIMIPYKYDNAVIK